MGDANQHPALRITAPHLRPRSLLSAVMATSSYADINPYEEAKLFTSNAERERYESMATLFSIVVSLDALERAYMREGVSEAQYAPACTRLLSQFKTISKLVMSNESGSESGGVQDMAGVPVIRDVQDFMVQFRMGHEAAAHRLRVGVPATVEHASAASSSSSSERAKWVAETTQGFITFMDALKLKLRAKDQLHPLLSDLMSSYSRFTDSSSGGQQQEGRAKVLHWLITLNQMKASDEIDEAQARQMLFDVENAYSAWFRSLQNT
jgi:ESCRT-I complex subunit VPS28